jgi:hypothetical protein
MKKILLSIAVILFARWAQAQEVIQDPNAEPRRLSEGFHAIQVSNAIDLYLSQGNVESVAVSASDKKIIPRITTVVRNGVLIIRFVNTGSIIWNMGNKKLKAYVSFKRIDKLSASGASDIDIQGSINSEKLDIDLSGASDLKGTLDVGELRMDQSGASDASINGKANMINLILSGASEIKGYDLVVDNCTINASGASDAHLTVNKEINVHASGASDVYYKGDAVIRDNHSSGSSTVSRKG